MIKLDKKQLAGRIEEITILLTNELSVVETDGEIAVVNKAHEILSEMAYYKENPADLKFVAVPNDKLGRKSVVCILRGKKGNSNKTVILNGHLDTVGISDYGALSHLANQPYALTEKFKEISHTLSKETQADLATGDYLFGRGIFDMKTGNAINIALVEAIANDLENFEGNLIYAGVCDEEANSAGMLSVVPELVKIRDENQFNYLGFIATDYMTSQYEGDENKYVYVGSVGKLMPSFFVVGKETHVGEAFNGLDSNHIAANITEHINMNVDYCDVVDGEVTLPPITLRSRDLKPEYSVQTAQTTSLFFNYATHSSTPDEVMQKMLDASQMVFEKTVRHLNDQYHRYCELSGRETVPLPWQARTISFQELYQRVKLEIGEQLDVMLAELSEALLKDETIDARDFALKQVEFVHKQWSDREPIVIVYFSPPYYPHIHVEGKTDVEKNMIQAVEQAVSETETDYNIVYKKFFPYIADMSYAAAPRDPGIIATLKGNTPGFNVKYDLPLTEMADLNLPVLNIGPFGKDAHQFTERLEKNYSFKVAPELVYRTISNLLQG
ncbi:MAG: M20/M25/M40 family metallo-hydrolase [Turicibacter sp.]|nr:M20/M25/M40 family metallo-hydrolase [Turicibacter sp.]